MLSQLESSRFNPNLGKPAKNKHSRSMSDNVEQVSTSGAPIVSGCLSTQNLRRHVEQKTVNEADLKRKLAIELIDELSNQDNQEPEKRNFLKRFESHDLLIGQRLQ